MADEGETAVLDAGGGNMEGETIVALREMLWLSWR